MRVATGISNPWYNSNFEDPNFGNDRYGPDLAIAVDPNDPDRVYITYVTGTSAADATLHLRWSDDGGQNWSSDVRAIPRPRTRAWPSIREASSASSTSRWSAATG